MNPSPEEEVKPPSEGPKTPHEHQDAVKSGRIPSRRKGPLLPGKKGPLAGGADGRVFDDRLVSAAATTLTPPRGDSRRPEPPWPKGKAQRDAPARILTTRAAGVASLHA